MKNLNEHDATFELVSTLEYNRVVLLNLMSAFKKGDFKELDSLLGIKDNFSNLMVRRKLEIIKYSIKAGIGADTNIKDEHGVTLLHLAAATGQKEVAQCLIGNGADINAEDVYSNTPIHHAAHRGNLEVVICLIESGARCNFILKSPPKKSILNYIEFGSFLQSMCSSQIASFVFDEKAVRNILEQTSDKEDLLRFTIQTVKNYVLQNGISSFAMHKIGTCNILSDNFKDSILKTLQPLFESAEEYVEAVDVESLFKCEQLSEFSDHAAIENTSKMLGELYQQD